MKYEHLKHINSVIQAEIDVKAIAGGAIRVIHGNAVVYEQELGYADKEKEIPNTKDTIYRLYSMTKPITAAAIMILYERGQLDLLAPAADFLEGFKNQKVWTDKGLVDADRDVTIQDLLNMTSGVVYPDETYEAGRRMGTLYGDANRLYNQGKPLNTIDFCNLIGRIPLEFQPGERWRYGASADILGAIIEVITGQKLGEFLQKEIFAPLGMVDTAFYVPKEKLGRFAAIYEYNPLLKQLEIFGGRFLGIGDFMDPPAFESGGAGLVSTIEDYSRFALMLINGGSYQGVSILGRKTVEYMTLVQLTEEQAKTFNWDTQIGYSYGSLMRHMVNPVKGVTNGTVGEFGWDGWTGNYFFIDPKENLIMIYMIQRCNGTNAEVIRRLRQIIYGAI